MSETLICDCNNNSNHHTYVDKHKETVVECTVCSQFIKLAEGEVYNPQSPPKKKKVK